MDFNNIFGVLQEITLADMFGLSGVVIVLWYYFLLLLGKCQSNSLIFSVANFLGSILILVSLWFSWNLSSFIIEIAWMFISLYGIVSYFRQPNAVFDEN